MSTCYFTVSSLLLPHHLVFFEELLKSHTHPYVLNTQKIEQNSFLISILLLLSCSFHGMSLLYSFMSLVVWSLTLASHQTDMFVQRGWGVHSRKKDEVLRQHGFLIFHNKSIFCFCCMNVLPTCMYIYWVCAWCPGKPKESVGCSGSRIKGCCKRPCG